MVTAAKKPKTLVLLDSHAILHRAYHALPDFVSSTGEPTGALYGLCTFLLKLVKDISPDYIAACYDLPGGTFRHEQYKEYKAGRPKADDALVAQLIRSREVMAAFGIPVFEMKGFEADDMLGTIVEQVKEKTASGELRVVIASGDMDTVQLVVDDRVTVYTLKKGLSDTVVYDEKAVFARYGFAPMLLADYKGLCGDPSDNITGVEGIGEKTATDLIVKFGSIDAIYEALKNGKLEKDGVKARTIKLLEDGEEDARFSRELATIRRDAPIEYVVPEKMWREIFDREKATAMLTQLGFKSLVSRIGVIGGEVADVAPATLPELTEKIDPEELQKMSLAVWVLDSTRTEPDLDMILSFARAQNFAEAREKILKQIEEEKLGFVLSDIEMPLVPVFHRAEEAGILVDKEYLGNLSKEYHLEASALEKKIWAQAGEEFNINSPKQLGEILFTKLQLHAKGMKKTAGGAQSTRESELLKLAGVAPIVDDILAYRELQKLLGTYIDVLPTLADGAGRVHTHFVQSGTATGRVASRDPNMQNIPMKTELGRKIRRAFVAEPGRVFLDFDYSQIELRVLAMLSGDEKLVKIFQTGGDIHEAVAREVFKVAPGEVVSKEQRRRAKVINFGIIYGMGVNALRENLGTNREEAQKFYDDYFANFPSVAAYIERVKEQARANGYTETIFGRRRYFPNIVRGHAFVKAAEERMAMNAPNQGTAADILKLAMVRADKMLADAGLSNDARLLLQVHDELLYEVREEKVAEATAVVRKAMEGVLDGDDRARGVPLVVSVKKGKNWEEVEEV